VVAFVSRAPGWSVGAEELIAFVGARLATYKTPAQIVFLDAPAQESGRQGRPPRAAGEAGTYAVETMLRCASLVCGVVFACVNAGVLLATLVNLGVQELLPPAALPGWGWRLGFLVGGLLGLLGFRLRRALEETPAFAQMQRRVAQLTR
jgi:hypothetical protein